MKIQVGPAEEYIGKSAAAEGSRIIKNAIEKRGYATIILATGASQFKMLNELVVVPGVDWSRVTMFHLDEYIGLPQTHKASFRKYLTERFLDKVPPLKEVHLINGENDPEEECRKLGKAISQHQIDVAFAGIGENAHLAFNDPPADFETEDPYIVVTLDEACRKQQMGEGWFGSLDDVPDKAISMSVKQIMESNSIICVVPGARKAQAVKNCIEGEVSNLFPASILRLHPDCSLYLDEQSMSALRGNHFHDETK